MYDYEYFPQEVNLSLCCDKHCPNMKVQVALKLTGLGQAFQDCMECVGMNLVLKITLLTNLSSSN